MLSIFPWLVNSEQFTAKVSATARRSRRALRRRQQRNKRQRIQHGRNARKPESPALQFGARPDRRDNVIDGTNSRQRGLAGRDTICALLEFVLDHVVVVVLQLVDGAAHVPRRNAGIDQLLP